MAKIWEEHSHRLDRILTTTLLWATARATFARKVRIPEKHAKHLMPFFKLGGLVDSRASLVSHNIQASIIGYALSV